MEDQALNKEQDQHKEDLEECLKRTEDLKIDSSSGENEAKDEFKEQSIEECEKEVMNEDSYKNIKNKVAKLLERSDSLISNILYKELEESKKYNKLKHDGLIDMLKSIIRELIIEGTNGFKCDKTSTTIRKIIVDYLHRFKDKFPYRMVKGDYGNKYKKSTVNEIVEFLDYLNLKPSKKLQQEYLECDLNRRLNELPSLKYLNLEFKDPMDSEVYEKLKKRFYSRPPYNYFLNSNIKFDRITYWGTHHYICKRHDEFDYLGFGIEIRQYGNVYQGYFDKQNKRTGFGREVGGSGTIYEGRFFYDGEREGMGEVEFEDGSKEVGNWTYGYRQGSFEYFDENGVKTSEKIYNEYDDYEREKRNIL